MKQVAEKIERKLQLQNLVTLSKAKDVIDNSASGFYWIYTKLPITNFSACARPKNTVHIDFSLMAKTHKGSKNIITQSGNDYWCIYNGKGKELKKRLSAGFTNTKSKTGKLALLRCFKEDDFRIKYIVCQSTSKEYGIQETYSNLQRDIERVWRLNYGWPFLCRT